MKAIVVLQLTNRLRRICLPRRSFGNMSLDSFVHSIAKKSREMSCDLLSGKVSCPYNSIGMHFADKRCGTTVLEAIRPTFPKIPSAAW